MEFRHYGKSACTAIIEVKNETGWGWSWPAKLRQNKQDAGADFAVLVTAAFPSSMDRFQKGASLFRNIDAILQLFSTLSSIETTREFGAKDRIEMLARGVQRDTNATWELGAA